MLSTNVIERYFTTGRHEQLLDAIAGNGLDLPMPLKVRLAEHPASAIALGLRRVIELTYGPTPLSRKMTADLRAHQQPDGSFGNDPLATAAAIAALGRVVNDHLTADPEDAVAQQHALEALAAMQDDDGLFRFPNDRTDQDRALTASFILWLMAADPAFRQTVRFADLVDWFESRHDHLDRPTARFFRMARSGVEAQELAHLTPNLAA